MYDDTGVSRGHIADKVINIIMRNTTIDDGWGSIYYLILRNIFNLFLHDCETMFNAHR